jgi:hypothetical protein
LSQNQTVFHRPSTHQLKGFLARCLIMGTSEGLAINGDHSLDGLADPLNPLHKTGFKLLGIHEGKDPAKAIMSGNPIGQIQQFRNKGFFRFGTFLTLDPSFCTAENSTHRQNDDIPQAMKFGSFHSWVFSVSKQGFHISPLSFFHLSVSNFFDLFYHLLTVFPFVDEFI